MGYISDQCNRPLRSYLNGRISRGTPHEHSSKTMEPLPPSPMQYLYASFQPTFLFHPSNCRLSDSSINPYPQPLLPTTFLLPSSSRRLQFPLGRLQLRIHFPPTVGLQYSLICFISLMGAPQHRISFKRSLRLLADIQLYSTF